MSWRSGGGRKQEGKKSVSVVDRVGEMRAEMWMKRKVVKGYQIWRLNRKGQLKKLQEEKELEQGQSKASGAVQALHVDLAPALC